MQSRPLDSSPPSRLSFRHYLGAATPPLACSRALSACGANVLGLRTRSHRRTDSTLSPHPSLQRRCFRRRNETFAHWLRQTPPLSQTATPRLERAGRPSVPPLGPTEAPGKCSSLP
ncbi:hypothetical protein NN561_017342 [Cricetulus griseus]